MSAFAFAIGAISTVARKSVMEAVKEEDIKYTEKDLKTCQAIAECSLILTTTVLWGFSLVVLIISSLFGKRKESE
jgi:hypothetical protein